MLVPVNLGPRAGELVVVRPILSERAMTAMPFELPAALAAELAKEVLPVGRPLLPAGLPHQALPSTNPSKPRQI